MSSQHSIVIKQENHLVPCAILANNAVTLAIDNPLASHVPDIRSDLALQRFTVLNHQMMGG